MLWCRWLWFKLPSSIIDYAIWVDICIGWCDPLLLLPQGKGGAWIHPNGNSSRGYGSDDCILEGTEEEVSGWSHDIRMALLHNWNDSCNRCCLLTKFRTHWDNPKYLSFCVPFNVVDEDSVLPSCSGTCWWGNVRVAPSSKGGPTEFERLVLANSCSRNIFITFFVGKSKEGRLDAVWM